MDLVGELVVEISMGVFFPHELFLRNATEINYKLGDFVDTLPGC